MGDPLGEGPTRPPPPTRSPRGTASARCPAAPGAHLPAAQGGGGAGSARWGRRRPPPPSRPFKAAGFRGRLGAGTAPRAPRGRLPRAVSSCQAPGVSRAPTVYMRRASKHGIIKPLTPSPSAGPRPWLSERLNAPLRMGWRQDRNKTKITLPTAADPSCSPHGSGKFRKRYFSPGPLPSRAPLRCYEFRFRTAKCVGHPAGAVPF